MQLVHTQSRQLNNGQADVDPVIASPATLWAALGERDAVVAPSVAGTNVVASPAPAINIEPSWAPKQRFGPPLANAK